MNKLDLNKMAIIAKQNVKANFKFATLSFIFIIFFVNVFQNIFGIENSIVGVIFTIMMSASMARDMTGAPVKHLITQAAVLVFMACAACFVSYANPLIALPINFITIFVILYSFTYEYSTHLYFPYILSYLFMVFISPVTPIQLPKRIIAMLVGAVCIICYQIFMGRNRVHETARDVLCTILDDAQECIGNLINSEPLPDNLDKIRQNLCRLSRIVYERRKKVLRISDASFAMVDSGRGLENLVILLHGLEGKPETADSDFLKKLSAILVQYEKFVKKKPQQIEHINLSDMSPKNSELARICKALEYVRENLLKMAHPDSKRHYHRTRLSFMVRLKAALDISQVRIVYSLRIGLLLAVCTMTVQLMGLPHGKWLLFTVALVSLPYADDIGLKAKKRFMATAVGGLFSLVAYSLIPSAAGRTALMMASGYMSFYMKDYTTTFACSTVGALGGAVFGGIFGWEQVGGMFLIRLIYICIGIAVAFVANCIILPYKRETAIRQLWEKYAATTQMLTEICRESDPDPQLYYSLVIQAHLQENKLCQSAVEHGWDDLKAAVIRYRNNIRLAHCESAIGVGN